MESPDARTVHHDHNYVDLRTCEQKLEDANRRIKYPEGILERRDLEMFGVERITADPQLLNFYTGFTGYETFKAAFRYWPKSGISRETPGVSEETVHLLSY